MVWDTIYGRGDQTSPVEEWGGIAYALAALEATLPEGWEMVPLIKVGRDLAGEANRFLAQLGKRAKVSRFVEVPQPNNRVTLRYHSSERRTECLSGGVPGWIWDELGPMVRDLDAIYVNFISGFELDLPTAQALRRAFEGPIYADLHSLFLGVGEGGTRVPRSLPDALDWLACFDAVQMNEDEMALLGYDPMAVAARAMQAGVGLLVITLGARGAVYFTTPSFSFVHRTVEPAEPIVTARVPAPAVAQPVDPTGCGDVFGASLVSHLLSGLPVETAVARANFYAALNVSVRGATQLHYYLKGAIVPA
jgi:sugar/nucleoside kinase (ribokinase family)